MRRGNLGVIGAHFGGISLAPLRRQQRRGDADGAAGVVDMHHRPAAIVRVDLDGGMDAAGSGAADQQRHLQALAFHLAGEETHLVERRRDQAGQADDVGALGFRGLDDLGGRHHDAEVDHLEIVTLQDDADDVLADVVDVALDGREHDLAGGLAAVAGNAVGEVARLLLFHERHQIGHRLLHHARGFHHLRQEHLAVAEEVADDVHAGHQRAFDHIERTLGDFARVLGIGLDIFGDAVHQRVAEPLLDRPFAPGQILLFGLLLLAAEFFRERQQPFGRAGVAVEDDVFAGLAQLRIDVVIDDHLPGIDDAHIHAGLDGVIQEHRMHRLAHRLVAAERERQVRDAAGNMGVRQVLRGSSASPR